MPIFCGANEPFYELEKNVEGVQATLPQHGEVKPSPHVTVFFIKSPAREVASTHPAIHFTPDDPGEKTKQKQRVLRIASKRLIR